MPVWRITMYDLYIMKRTQIYLDESQAEELARRATARGATSSLLIREAVNAYLTGPDDDAAELSRQRSAIRQAAGSIPRLSQDAAYVDDLRRVDHERDRDLEERWRSR